MSQWTREPPQFRLQIDYDQLVWEALLDCQHSFRMPDFESMMQQGSSIGASKVTEDRFIYNVDVLANYVLPEWEDLQYRKDLQEWDEDRFKLHKAIIRLLHRRNFFKRKDLLEEIEGILEETGSPIGSSKESIPVKTS